MPNDAVWGRTRTHALNFAQWCQTGGVKGFVSGVGVPKLTDSTDWNDILDRWYQLVNTYGLWVTYWPTGEFLGTTHALAAYEDVLPGIEEGLPFGSVTLPQSTDPGCRNYNAYYAAPGSYHEQGGGVGLTGGNIAIGIGGPYTYWNTLSGLCSQIRCQFRVEDEPNAPGSTQEGRFWSCFGQQSGTPDNGYYFGVQTRINVNGYLGKGVIFSMWSAAASNAATESHAQAYAAAFGGEGVGHQTLLPYAWTEGTTYTMRVVRDVARGDRWWTAYIKNESSGIEQRVGSIQAHVNALNGLQKTAIQFTEHYLNETAYGSCPVVPYSRTYFGQPIVTSGAGTPGIDTARNPSLVVEQYPSVGATPWAGGNYIHGINVVGGELNDNVLPGVYDTNYHYDGQATFDYLAGRNQDLFRVPIRWERLQRTLNGALDTDETNRIAAIFDRIAASGQVGVLDIHNRGGYKISGTEHKIGSATVTQAHYIDFLTKLVQSPIWTKSAFFALGLMDRPTGIPLDGAPNEHKAWEAHAQAGVNAIRAAEATPVDFDRLWGFFIDTNEHLVLTDGTVPQNKYKYIICHWNIGSARRAEIQAYHPASTLLAYQNFGAMLFGPHPLGKPTVLVTSEEANAHGVGADSWYLHNAAVTITSSSTAAPPLFTTAAAHGLAVDEGVDITGHSVSARNGTWVVASTPSSTTFTLKDQSGIAMPSGSAGSGGQMAEIRLYDDYSYLRAAHVGRASYVAQCANHLAGIKADGWKGVAVDDVNFGPPNHGLSANPTVEFPTDISYRDAVVSAMATLKAQAAALNLLWIPNVGLNPWETDPMTGYMNMINAGSVDGVTREYVINFTGDPGFFTGPTYRDMMKLQTDTEAAGKFVLLNAYPISTPNHTESIRYLGASFYTYWNAALAPNSTFGYNDGKPIASYPEYRKLIGTPLGAKTLVAGTVNDGGAWRRYYQYGVALVNARNVAGNVVFNLDSTYLDPAGNPVTSVTLAPERGMILVKQGSGIGTTKRLSIPLSGSASAPNAATNHPTGPWIVDPAGSGYLVYEAQHFFHSANDGTYPNSYANEVAAATAAGFTAVGVVPGPPPVVEPKAWYVPTGAQNPNNHGTTDVTNGLVGRLGSRQWAFRYELLTNSHARLFDLDEVLEASVEHQYLADIKRKATFSIRDRGRINYLSDRIRPWVRLHLPPYGTNDWVEWPLGVFLLTSPTRHADEYDRVTRAVEGYDPMQWLAEDLISTRYIVAAGTNIVNNVASLVAGAAPTWKITRSSETLPTTKEWPPGTSKLVIANELLAIAEYESVSFDGFGDGVLRPYQSPEARASMWTYAYGQESLIVPNVDQELDLFTVPNKWVAVVSEPDRPLLVASYTNANPASPTSTVRRGRTIVDFREQEEASSLTVLQNKVKRYAFEASQIYEHLKFETGLMPIHGTNDTYWLDYDPLAVNAKYAETSWTIKLEAGAPMMHEARRIVGV